MPTEHAWPTEERISRLRRFEGVFNRRWSCFDFHQCTHPLMVGVGSMWGKWTVEICPICGHTVSQCLHEKMEWNEAGTLLRCATCGIDGT
jgi:hypothetical protein